ncbi:hypothetical protein BAUCODRAFT_76313 [Baudoinia panamericana UAMH 10762]|uniref:Uncharacterized protein n=1 Tax=Baudoinia panamericana (strain UAMH 10762) TaxID=717646 RepID=M2MAC1_BAUPA|nr:uncharacterized protein BAUCODRAFT_76313 [Baudoinia panamericana UAMH 10762]EMC93421.1 hypothetical protein BAUCODRAFT_76313 [Baudoinia panamericana UAMH 10762]
MCCHRLFVYSVCGHSAFSITPLILCQDAAIAPDAEHSSRCELVAHPYRSLKLDMLCPSCQQRRDAILGRVEQCQVVTYDEYKWKVSYAMPAHGKDFWTRKMEEKEAKETEERKQQKDMEKRKRFSWKRASKKSVRSG